MLIVIRIVTIMYGGKYNELIVLWQSLRQTQSISKSQEWLRFSYKFENWRAWQVWWLGTRAITSWAIVMTSWLTMAMIDCDMRCLIIMCAGAHSHSQTCIHICVFVSVFLSLYVCDYLHVLKRDWSSLSYQGCQRITIISLKHHDHQW